MCIRDRYSTLWSFDFFETKDSKACAIASKPAEAFILLGADINNKEIKFFYKNSDLPILEELIEIIKEIKNFKPNLILAVGGGAVID